MSATTGYESQIKQAKEKAAHEYAAEARHRDATQPECVEAMPEVRKQITRLESLISHLENTVTALEDKLSYAQTPQAPPVIHNNAVPPCAPQSALAYTIEVAGDRVGDLQTRIYNAVEALEI